MRRPVFIPADPEITVVRTVADLLTHKRVPHEAMILAPRPIKGRFNDLALWLMHQSPYRDQKIAGTDAYLSVRYKVQDIERFAHTAGMKWHDELDLIRTDMYRMENAKGESAELRIVRENGYHPETYQFHQNQPGQNNHVARIREMGDIMCCYTDPTTECLLSADAIPLPAVPGQYMPHFKARDGAKTFRPGVGDMWRQASLGQGARALIHKANEIFETGKKSSPRMLVVC